jgi:hypothetical protein
VKSNFGGNIRNKVLREEEDMLNGLLFSNTEMNAEDSYNE